ncbi:MAG: DMT family transporter [Gemmatimonadaceae bacterium]|nr:DMT family transporter [Gemmatimonadaceae bacterium]
MSPAVVLAMAVLGISFGGPLTRLSGAPALTVAAGRLGFSLVVVAVALVATGSWRQLRTLGRRDLLVGLGAGGMLAVHFWSWNASLNLTTVSASVVLVDMQPAIVGLLSVVWLREMPTRRQWGGIAIAMVGAVVVTLPDLMREGAGVGGRALFGDALAFVGAIAGACYFVAGRKLRATLDLWPYVAVVYGACFVVLIAAARGTGVVLLPQPPRQLVIFAALALGPMLLGHTGLNYALRYVPAYVVNLALLCEPIGATILAALIPSIHEFPNWGTVAGGALVLFGIARATTRGAPPAVADA